MPINTLKKLSLITITTLLLTSIASKSDAASPFRLEYSIDDLGSGLYDYEFDLILDNNDGSWLPGQEFDWFVFGDCGLFCTSPLTNWITDTSRTNPALGSSLTSGGHNGPNVGWGSNFVSLPGFSPASIGEKLEWAGTSTASLDTLLWSNIVASSGASRANLESAILVDRNIAEQIPTPALLPGLIGMATTALRKKKQQELA